MARPITLLRNLGFTGSLVMLNAMAAVAEPSLVTSTPVCFMETANGQIVDLSRLCGPSDQQTTSPTVQSTSITQQRRGRGAAQR
ncbi:hypothetical protein N836_32245 [Leptolyngbya sp. Heron Island J]|uniref:hypothetical protein n=1 Tax=Leptolyngbya sp. Heron Island J TaxID=1385935 RepID=UPI0003B9841D|nr:hypothetical protein [Leptolyngbya sp. Heron Island J]ESA38612.1 hypothetical protein N836_32245 [Leptolyngbya sp. Heron Island J]